MRHFRFLLLAIGLASVLAEAGAALAVFWHGRGRATDFGTI